MAVGGFNVDAEELDRLSRRLEGDARVWGVTLPIICGPELSDRLGDQSELRCADFNPAITPTMDGESLPGTGHPQI